MKPSDASSESAPLQNRTIQIPLHRIDVGKRLRGLKAARLSHIKESLADRGQLQAILVKPTEDGRYALLAGSYRKAAAEKLGWETIRAEVREGLSEDECPASLGVLEHTRDSTHTSNDQISAAPCRPICLDRALHRHSRVCHCCGSANACRWPRLRRS